MHKHQPLYLLLALVTIIIFISCVSQRKVASAKIKLTAIDSQFLKYDKTLAELNTQRKKKQEQNEIDDTANVRIQKFIDSTNADIDSLLTQHSILIGTTIVNITDWKRLVKSLSFSQKTSKKINGMVLLITEQVYQNTVVNLDQDLLFESGQYRVTKAVAAAIGKYFEPAAKEIDLFTKKYPNFPLSLVITAKGYADGMSIGEGTALYKDLTERLKLSGSTPDSKELNKELSRARAEEIIALFKKFAARWSGKRSYIKNILYFYEGKGEAFPNPKIADYKTDDPRRRVVLLYWSVFPE
jgi:flagellar motor protein MotB